MNDVQNGTHFYGYDGNGNVSALVSASNGEFTANYEYGPFGEPTRVSGIMSKENPFRFSTKRAVDFIDIILYEYRAYSPTIGRWLSRDPIDTQNGANIYSFVGNNSLNSFDVLGLWDSGVHNNMTLQWAQMNYYTDVSAEAIASADNAVDGGILGWGMGWAPYGDQSYHFNRNLGGGIDSRLRHNAEHLQQAKRACTMKDGKDDPREAAKQLGKALHSLQDWVAHGDFFIQWVGPVMAGHNAYSLQNPIPSKKGRIGIVDDIDFDAVMPDGSQVPDGRPAGAAMQYYNLPATSNPNGAALLMGQVPSGNGMRVDWAMFKGGHLRINKTKELTVRDLKDFMDYVKANGGCKCRRYFDAKFSL